MQSKRGAGRASVGRLFCSPWKVLLVGFEFEPCLVLGGKFEQQLLWWLLLVYRH